MPVDNAALTAAIAKVSRANLERDVRHLSTAWPTRHTLSQFLSPASEWLAGRLRECGLRDVSFHEYREEGRALRNVVGVQRGDTPETIILCGHFDSRMQDLDDSKSPAPGANDNGTGVAAILETARILAPMKLRCTIRYVLFSGEEQGLWGSTAYAQKVKAERTPVRFVFNLDELGFPPRDRALFVDRDEGGAVKSNDAAGRALVERIQALARDVVNVPTRVDPAVDSDYVPFEAQGFVIAGLYEAGKDYPAYHKTTDTFEKVDFAYVTDMVRLTVATILSESAA